MQISRRVLLACMTATALLPLSSHAQGNEAQEKAQQALQQKMKELQSQPPAAPVPSHAPQSGEVPPVEAPAVKTVPPEPVAGNQDALQEALRQKLNALQQQPPLNVPPPTSTPAPAAATPEPAPGEPADDDPAARRRAGVEPES